MTTQIESLKAEYLAFYQKHFPRLKELALAVRDEDIKLTDPSENRKFWEITDDSETNLQLCQLAHDLDDRLFAALPFDNEAQEGDRINTPQTSLQHDISLLMDKLFKLEALLKLIEGNMSDMEDRSAIRLAVELTQNALDFVDMKIELSIRNL